MRKIRGVLRLHSLGLKQRQIARACAIGQSTVSDYIKQAEAAGLLWADIAGWDEDRLLAKLAPVATPALPKDLGRLPQPDYAGIHAELQKHKHLTLQLVWEEYRTRHPEGYRYSRYVVAEEMLRPHGSFLPAAARIACQHNINLTCSCEPCVYGGSQWINCVVPLTSAVGSLILPLSSPSAIDTCGTVQITGPVQRH